MTLVSEAAAIALDAPELYIKRELSWLAVNARVLAQATNERHPLLERVKFLAIVGSNLDEFFMIRVAALQKQLRTRRESISPDGLTTEQQLAIVREHALRMMTRQSQVWEQQLRPELARHGIAFLDSSDYTEEVS